MKIKVDGKPFNFKLDRNKYRNAKEFLRLFEFHYLFPDRVIKSIEIDGEKVPIDVLRDLKDFSKLNVVTDLTVNFLKRNIEIAIMVLDSMPGAVETVADSFETAEEVAFLHVDYIVDSILKTLEIVEKGKNFIPIIDGFDRAVLDIEDKILKLNEMEKNGILDYLKGEFSDGIEKWKEFLIKVIMTIDGSSTEIH